MMNKKYFLLTVLVLQKIICMAQFAPAVGHAGTTAIFKDSSCFIDWASKCTVHRGLQDISNPSLGYASVGDSSYAIGKADGIVVSLGDSGVATLTFQNPIVDGAGFDFAVFENAFTDSFLELGFVEVSSDGQNFYRFPATSNTQDTLQITNAGSVQATKINNLAGKYRVLYGTPFDLNELSGISGLNLQHITHVRVIDVIGCVQERYATYDKNGHKINDPWNTPFPSSGFDLDAVGVIHEDANGVETLMNKEFEVYPNPANNNLKITQFENLKIKDIQILNLVGSEIYSNFQINPSSNSQIEIDLSQFQNGIYFLQISDGEKISTTKFVVNHD
jgi:Secretion system C-terminal sorting domain